MDIHLGERLEAERRRVGIDLADLWVAYIGVGGLATPADMEDYLRGARTFTRIEHDMLAQAINDYSVELGLNHPAPYAEQAAGDGGGDGDTSTPT
jgi:hypothetical protein